MTFKEVVPGNTNPSKSQRDILYALGDDLYTTERVAKRHESMGKTQIVSPKELQTKMKEYFGNQPKDLTDYPKDESKNYRIFSATPEGVKAAEAYAGSSLEDRRKSDAQWRKSTKDLLNKIIESDDPKNNYVEYGLKDRLKDEKSRTYVNALKICALQAAQNEVSVESKEADQHYLRVKNGKENAAKHHEKTTEQDGPEL